MNGTNLLAVTLLIFSSLVSCKSFQMEVYQSVRIESDGGYKSGANQATLEYLLAETEEAV